MTIEEIESSSKTLEDIADRLWADSSTLELVCKVDGEEQWTIDRWVPKVAVKTVEWKVYGMLDSYLKEGGFKDDLYDCVDKAARDELAGVPKELFRSAITVHADVDLDKGMFVKTYYFPDLDDRELCERLEAAFKNCSERVIIMK